MDDAIKQLFSRTDRTDVFLIGRTGVGKTTLASDLKRKNIDSVRSIFLGQACRKHFGERVFIESENAVTPDVSEEFVRQMIADAVSLDDTQFVIIDSFPKSPEQVQWAIKTSYNPPVFLYVVCDESVRLERLGARDKSGEKKALTKKRNEQESDSLMRTIEELYRLNASIMVYDSSPHNVELAGWRDNFDFVIPRTMDAVFKNITREFGELPLKKHGHGVSPLMIHNQARRRVNTAKFADLCVMWIRRFVEDMQGEIGETLAELPKNWRDRSDIALNRVRIELADIFHFLMSAVDVAGMTSKEFFDLVEQKRQVNINRVMYGRVVDDDALLGFLPKREKPVVYLGGPIKLAGDERLGNSWRRLLIERLGDKYAFLDPLERRLSELGSRSALIKNMDLVVQRDLEDIALSDVLLIYLPDVSAGTAMEEFFANRTIDVPAVVILPDGLSTVGGGWILEHAYAVIMVPADPKPDEFIDIISDVLDNYERFSK